MLGACSTAGTLQIESVTYQSVRTTFDRPKEVPEDAKIALFYNITKSGELNVIVKNLTDEIMTIDNTRSFFVGTNGQSQSYYDPTVRTVSNTELSSKTEGASVNLGAIGGALGIGGSIGALLGGINVGGSSTGGTSKTTITYMADQPLVQLAPKADGAMSKSFQIEGIGRSSHRSVNAPNFVFQTQKESPYKFSVCISYSIDNGTTYNKLVTDFYINSSFSVPVNNLKTNDAFVTIYAKKPDALFEPLYFFYIDNNMPLMDNQFDVYNNGFLFDYQ